MPQPVVRASVAMCLLSAGLMAFQGAATAEEPVGEAVTLESLIAEALKNGPQARAARERQSAARWRVPQASALPDPSVSYAVMGDMLETRLGPQENVWEVEQMVPFPTKLWERHRIASAEAKGETAVTRGVERSVVQRVSEIYYDLHAVEASLQVLEEMHGALQQLEGVAQARYASQGGTQRDAAKAQTEVSEVLHRIFTLQQQRQTLQALLNAVLNRDPRAPLGATAAPAVPEPPKPLEDLIAAAQRHRPELLEAQAMEQRERHAKALANMEYLPDLSVGFQYTQIGTEGVTDPDAGRDAWMIPLKVTVPLWINRLIPGSVEASRRLRASQAELNQAQNMTEYEVRDAYYRVTTGRHVVELFQNATIPQAEMAYKADVAGYEGGRTDVLDLVDSERVYLNAKIAYHEALAEMLKSYAALERAVGVSLTEPSHDAQP